MLLRALLLALAALEGARALQIGLLGAAAPPRAGAVCMKKKPYIERLKTVDPARIGREAAQAAREKKAAGAKAAEEWAAKKEADAAAAGEAAGAAEEDAPAED